MMSPEKPPILANKRYAVPSAFTPENLLREARRQKGLCNSSVPEVCVLDPDGDIVRQTKNAGLAKRVCARKLERPSGAGISA